MKENMVLIHRATQYRPNQKNNCSSVLKLPLLFKLWAVNSSKTVLFFKTKFIH